MLTRNLVFVNPPPPFGYNKMSEFKPAFGPGSCGCYCEMPLPELVAVCKHPQTYGIVVFASDIGTTSSNVIFLNPDIDCVNGHAEIIAGYHVPPGCQFDASLGGVYAVVPNGATSDVYHVAKAGFVKVLENVVSVVYCDRNLVYNDSAGNLFQDGMVIARGVTGTLRYTDELAQKRVKLPLTITGYGPKVLRPESTLDLGDLTLRFPQRTVSGDSVVISGGVDPIVLAERKGVIDQYGTSRALNIQKGQLDGLKTDLFDWSGWLPNDGMTFYSTPLLAMFADGSRRLDVTVNFGGTSNGLRHIVDIDTGERQVFVQRYDPQNRGDCAYRGQAGGVYLYALHPYWNTYSWRTKTFLSSVTIL